jgi:hypothetical protein
VFDVNSFLLFCFVEGLMQGDSANDIEKKLHNLILFPNQALSTQSVKGYDFNNGVDYDSIFKAYANTGLQATNFAEAISIVN